MIILINTSTGNKRFSKSRRAKLYFPARIKKVFGMAVFIALSVLTTNALAENQYAGKIEEVIISATRTEKLTSEVPNTVSVIDAEQIQR
ncbi:MAG: hypothetical protein JKX81_13710, partial [Arenicella sp.]|nr:hypothetical protein [Arenicella sp.]